MEKILEKIKTCIEFGKVNQKIPFPPELKDQDGADELTQKALENGIKFNDIVTLACIPAMDAIGEKFQRNEVFVPQLLIAAKAMKAAMGHLKPYNVYIIKTYMGIKLPAYFIR